MGEKETEVEKKSGMKKGKTEKEQDGKPDKKQ